MLQNILLQNQSTRVVNNKINTVDGWRTRHFAFLERGTRGNTAHEREIELTAARLMIILLIELNSRICGGPL